MAGVGLVLGSGGSKGYAWHVGVLAAMEQAFGVDPALVDVVVGTSAGAIAAAFVRSGIPAAELWTDIHDRPQPAASRALLTAAGPSATAASPRPRWRPENPALLALALRRRTRLLAGLAGLLPAAAGDAYSFIGPLRDGPTPWPARETLLCAVRVGDGRREVFGSGDVDGLDLGAAAAASAAVPGMVAPMWIGVERFIDGAVWSPTSADLVAGRPLDLLVVSAPMRDPRSRRLLRQELRRAAAARVVVLVPPRRMVDRADAATLGRQLTLAAD